jgi:DNA ligase-1
MQFSEFSDKLSLLETTESRLKIRDYIYELYTHLNKEEIKIATYLLQSRIFPAYVNKELNIGQSTIIQAISKSFGLNVKDIEAKHMQLGDLGQTAEHFAEIRKQKSLFSKKISLLEVYNTLKALIDVTGKDSVDNKINLIASLYNNTTPKETKYITKIILKSLRLNLGIQTIIEACALKVMYDKNYKTHDENMPEYKKIKELIDLKQSISNDLGLVVETIFNLNIEALDTIKIKPGIPIKSALGEREISPEAIINRLGYCMVEGKYDGFRTQLHKEGNKINMYSRRGEDSTNYFPEFKKILENVKHDFILDCEAIGYDVDSKKFLSFQETIKRKRKYDVKEMSEKIPVKLIAFDILYLDGKETLSLTLEERRKILEKLVSEINNYNVQTSISIKTDKPKELKSFFDKCLELSLEGIIAKDLKKPYVPGSRDFAWIKLKKNYLEGQADSFDVCVVGYFNGQGKNKNMPSSLLVAVYDEEHNMYNVIAKVGSGLTEENMQFFKTEFEAIKTSKPENLNTDLVPDEYVEPKFVIEIVCDEITKSPLYKFTKGFSFRFPRFILIREDKTSKDTTTIDEIEEMYYLQHKNQTPIK